MASCTSSVMVNPPSSAGGGRGWSARSGIHACRSRSPCGSAPAGAGCGAVAPGPAGRPRYGRWRVRASVARPQQDRQRLPGAFGAVISEDSQRVMAVGLLHMGIACSFSGHAVTIVAPVSTVTRPPSAPGAARPARSHARTRAPACAARMAFSVGGASPASRATSGAPARRAAQPAATVRRPRTLPRDAGSCGHGGPGKLTGVTAGQPGRFAQADEECAGRV
jgi:hypothetical protein